MYTSERIKTRGSRGSHPMRRATDHANGIANGNLLAMVADGPAPEDEVREDHLIASSLQVEQTAIDAEGHMDNHRRPIISVHGKDIDEHELGKNVA